MRNTVKNIIANAWFFCIVIEMIIFTILTMIAMFFGEILVMLKNGQSVDTIGFSILSIAGLIISITGIVPVFRKCIYIYPWLYSLFEILIMDNFILSMAEMIIAKGFATKGALGHTVIVLLMIVQIVICRILMCWYLKRKPLSTQRINKDEFYNNQSEVNKIIKRKSVLLFIISMVYIIVQAGK